MAVGASPLSSASILAGLMSAFEMAISDFKTVTYSIVSMPV